MFLISGEDKAEAVARAFGDAPGPDAPASLVRPDAGEPHAAARPARRRAPGGRRVRRIDADGAVGASPFPPDRRLRLPVRLRDHGAGRAERQRRVDVPAADGLAERVRRDPRPRRRQLPPRSRRRGGAGGPALPARHDGARDQLGHPRRLDHRARRAADRPVAPRGRALHHPPPLAHRLRRRPRAAAPGALRERRGAGEPRLRAGRSTTAASSRPGSTRARATTRRWPPPTTATCSCG